jgi:hypothetical protein
MTIMASCNHMHTKIPNYNGWLKTCNNNINDHS